MFTNAILQSGGPTCNWGFISADEGRQRSHKYLQEFYSLITKRLLDDQHKAERDQIPEICQRGSTVTDVEVMFQCAINYPIMDEDHYAYITNAEYTIQDGGPIFFLLMPVIDGTFLPLNPITMLKTGNFKVEKETIRFCFRFDSFRRVFDRNVRCCWAPIVMKVHILWFMLKEMKKLREMHRLMFRIQLLLNISKCIIIMFRLILIKLLELFFNR